MKFIVNEPEIREAVKQFLSTRILVGAGEMQIDFTAGRGPNGLTAEVDVDYLGVEALPEVQQAVAKTVPFQEPAIVEDVQEEKPVVDNLFS